MATADFVTKQQPTVNIIISITQIAITIVDDAVLSLLIVVSLFRCSKGEFGSTWLQNDEPSDHGDGNFGPIAGQL
jgi:hypothetical protein